MLSQITAQLSTTRTLRRIVLPFFERFNPGNIRIRHHYTGDRLLLHSYRHRGYWFHGRRREQTTMQFFRQVLRPGDAVIEIGGHIGYLTIYFSKLVGSTGRVVVFEPGQNNLPYLHTNVGRLPNVEIVEMAVSDTDGVASFFEERLTGQNNSLLGDYERFKQNRESAFSHQAYRQRDVRTVRLDTFLRQRALWPDLIKIDIEGAEYLALAGALQALREHRPMLLIEVTRQTAEVFQLLTGIGYQLFYPEGHPVSGGNGVNDNICALHVERHSNRLPQWPSLNARAA